MNDFDLKRADRDAALYNTDGRFFDLTIADGVLSLKLRRALALEWSLIIALIFLSFWMLQVVLAYFAWGKAPGRTVMWLDILKNSGMALLNYLGWYSIFIASQCWILDKTNGKIRYGPIGTAPLTSIYQVAAWQKGAKFYVALKSRNDKPRQLGRFGFCRSENAWRQDAAQIAEFLGVPLEISPALPD